MQLNVSFWKNGGENTGEERTVVEITLREKKPPGKNLVRKILSRENTSKEKYQGKVPVP